MKIKISELRQMIAEAVLSEIGMEDVSDVCFAAGSTHVMRTCSIGGGKYYLKFSDDSLFDETDPSLQILVEFLAYRVYGLFANVRVPKVELVYDKEKSKVGLASGAIAGKMGRTEIDPERLGRMMSAGVYVDILLANWDVVGTGSGNVIVTPDDQAHRIDPGGALTFRAQGGRKGDKFGPNPGEIKTMVDASFGGSGQVFQHADLRSAAREFMSVPWSAISQALSRTTNEVAGELRRNGMSSLSATWSQEAKHIAGILQKRYVEVAAHAQHILAGK